MPDMTTFGVQWIASSQRSPSYINLKKMDIADLEYGASIFFCENFKTQTQIDF
jgi:hypothetical protein